MQGTKLWTTQQYNGCCGGSGPIGNTGIFVDARSNTLSQNVLVGKGGSGILLVINFERNIRQDSNAQLDTAIQREFVAVNDLPINVYGPTRLNVKIGSKSYKTTAIVLDNSTEGASGLDFMMENCC